MLVPTIATTGGRPMTSWTIHQRTVDVYPGEKADSPVIYLNTYADVDQSMYQDIRARSGRDFSLVTISKLTWNHDMSPWAAGPISKRDAAFTGGADDYLKLLTDEIVPAPAWGRFLRVSRQGAGGAQLGPRVNRQRELRRADAMNACLL